MIKSYWKILTDVINDINNLYELNTKNQIIELDGIRTEIQVKRVIPILKLNKEIQDHKTDKTVIMSLEVSNIDIIKRVYQFPVGETDEFFLQQAEYIFLKDVIINGLLHKSLSLKDSAEYQRLLNKNQSLNINKCQN